MRCHLNEGVVAFRPSVQFRVGYYHLDYIIIKEVIEGFYRISEVTWGTERFCTPLESVRKLAGQVDLPPFSPDRCRVTKNSSLCLERVGAGERGGGKQIEQLSTLPLPTTSFCEYRFCIIEYAVQSAMSLVNSY